MIEQATIKVRGPDAADFLQGQLTNDLRLLVRSASVRSAWCNPKGRVICLFQVSTDDAGYCLLLPMELADAILRERKGQR